MSQVIRKADVRDFESHFNKSDGQNEHDCWLYDRVAVSHGKSDRSTGYMTWRGVGARRAAWFFANGAWPQNSVCAAPCFVRNCVRPSHLKDLTHKELHEIAASLGRKITGVQAVEVTAEMVIGWRREIRLAEEHGKNTQWWITRDAISERDGVAISTVIKAVDGTGENGTWPHLPGALGPTTAKGYPLAVKPGWDNVSFPKQARLY